MELEITPELTSHQFNVATHNGFITVQSVATDNHRTFRIKTAKSGPLKGKRIVSLLIGPDRDNYQDWLGFAFVDDNGVVKVWGKYKGSGDIKSDYEKYAHYLQTPQRFEEKGLLSFLFEGRCRRCGRALTVPSSIFSGIGPECAQKEEF